MKTALIVLFSSVAEFRVPIQHSPILSRRGRIHIRKQTSVYLRRSYESIE